MKTLKAILTAAAIFAGVATVQVGPLGDAGRPTTYTAYNFTQLIDHFQNSSRYTPNTNGTFNQRYWYDNTYYKQEPYRSLFLSVDR
jgi:hypothetical protein